MSRMFDALHLTVEEFEAMQKAADQTELGKIDKIILTLEGRLAYAVEAADQASLPDLCRAFRDFAEGVAIFNSLAESSDAPTA